MPVVSRSCVYMNKKQFTGGEMFPVYFLGHVTFTAEYQLEDIKIKKHTTIAKASILPCCLKPHFLSAPK